MIRHILALLTIAALTIPTLALAASADDIAARLQSTYDQTKDMKASFTQSSVVKAMNMKREGSGTLIIKKPGLMRYTYDRPEKQDVIVRGEELIMFTPSTNTVIKKKLSRAMIDETPTTFLAGVGRISDSFNVAFPATGEKDKTGNWRLLLTPKKKGMSVKDVVLSINPTTFNITSFSFTETSGNLTEITLQGIKTNGGIKDSAFEFKIPKGAKLVSD